MPRPEQHLAGRYELIEPIGSGGLAVVWLARELSLDRLVAVKILRPELARDPDVAASFESEARRAASFAHENVAAVYDTGVDGDVRFVVTELLGGGSVADALDRRRRLEPGLAAGIAASAAQIGRAHV